MLEESLEISVLFDFYGPLLTERQQTFVDLYFNEDLSLTEIADRFGVTKQAVSDGLKKSEIDINRKMLSEIAINDPAAFTKLCETAKNAL